MISGAGPTILLISKESLNIKFKDWQIIEQKVNYKGAYIYEK
jgi:homoserine kinase